MSPFAITVEFVLHEGAFDRFLDLVATNARTSLKEEDGCHRFDVLVPRDRNDQVWLYEIYADERAFEDHLKTPHFAEFNAATADLVKEKRRMDFRVHA
jgi:quinol monooxygenase YgiN